MALIFVKLSKPIYSMYQSTFYYSLFFFHLKAFPWFSQLIIRKITVTYDVRLETGIYERKNDNKKK